METTTVATSYHCNGCGKNISRKESLIETEHLPTKMDSTSACVFCFACIISWLHSEQTRALDKGLPTPQDDQYNCPNRLHCNSVLSRETVLMARENRRLQQPIPSPLRLPVKIINMKPKKKTPRKIQKTIISSPQLLLACPQVVQREPGFLMMETIFKHVPDIDDTSRAGLQALLRRIEDMISLDNDYCKRHTDTTSDKELESLLYLLNRQMMTTYYIFKARLAGLNLTSVRELNKVTQCLMNDAIFERDIKPHITPSSPQAASTHTL